MEIHSVMQCSVWTLLIIPLLGDLGTLKTGLINAWITLTALYLKGYPLWASPGDGIPKGEPIHHGQIYSDPFSCSEKRILKQTPEHREPLVQDKLGRLYHWGETFWISSGCMEWVNAWIDLVSVPTREELVPVLSEANSLAELHKRIRYLYE